MTVRAEWLTVGGPAQPWRDIGLVVDAGGLIALFGTGIRIDERGPPGLVGWALSGTDGSGSAIDGLPTDAVAALRPTHIEHPLGVIGLDHVVIVTDELERTSEAIGVRTGAPLRRVRELGEMRQGFHRLGSLVVELVERAGLQPGPAAFWGLVINVEDLSAAVELLGPERIGPAKDAVQPGRSIATLRPEAGLGLPVALMTL